MASIPTAYFLLAFFFLIMLALLNVLLVYLWKPLCIHRALRAQGIQGPPFRPFVGNLSELAALSKAESASALPFSMHNIAPRVKPHWVKWSEKYGSIFLYWLGHIPWLVVTDPELCKEVVFNKLGHYGQFKSVRPELADLFGDGLVALEGKKWAQHRRIVHPAFFAEKLKAMAPTFVDLTTNMLNTWQSKLQSAKSPVEIDASEEFKALTADVIAHTAFGSSYAEGKKVFQLQHEQQKLYEKVARSFYIPGSRYLPTAMNRRRWNMCKQIKTILEGIVCKRLDHHGVNRDDGSVFGDDLLGLMLSAFKESQETQSDMKMSLHDIVEECKTFFIGGHETTSLLLTWTVMLLATSPEWQDRAREEVRNLSDISCPEAEGLNQMKVVVMILREALRLYPPIPGLFREVSISTKLGKLLLPQGAHLELPLLPFQVDPTLWGSDAYEFNPQRFADGVLKASKHPSAFQPFSTGPRHCVGQNFAMMQAKIVVCMLLQRFRFTLAPGYKHSPLAGLTLQAEHGVQIIVETC